LAALAWRYAGYDIAAASDHATGVLGSFRTSHTLNKNLAVVI
jgi:hypothetical protein